jgi:hypothetical protein
MRHSNWIITKIITRTHECFILLIIRVGLLKSRMWKWSGNIACLGKQMNTVLDFGRKCDLIGVGGWIMFS